MAAKKSQLRRIPSPPDGIVAEQWLGTLDDRTRVALYVMEKDNVFSWRTAFEMEDTTTWLVDAVEYSDFYMAHDALMQHFFHAYQVDLLERVIHGR